MIDYHKRKLEFIFFFNSIQDYILDLLYRPRYATRDFFCLLCVSKVARHLYYIIQSLLTFSLSLKDDSRFILRRQMASSSQHNSNDSSNEENQPPTMPLEITSTDGNFHYKKKRYDYTVYSGPGQEPLNDIGKIGDVWSTGDGRIWVHKEKKWIRAKDGRDTTTYPYERYPGITDVCLGRDPKIHWASTAAFRKRRAQEELAKQPKRSRTEEPGPSQNEAEGDNNPEATSGPSHARPTTPDASDEINRPQSPALEDLGPAAQRNPWLKNVYDQWCSHPVSSLGSLYRFGVQIFEAIFRHDEEFSPEGETIRYLGNLHTNDSVPPTLELALVDFFAREDINASECKSGQPPGSITRVQWLLGWNTGSLPEWPEDRPVYNALNIYFSTLGLKLCKVKTPDELKPFAQYDDWTTALCPSGSITRPHFDYNGASQLMHHFAGDKFWIIWPPTKKNRDWWDLNLEKFYTDKNNATIEAIDQLEKMELLYFKDTEPKTFILPPSYFHCVLTLTSSAHFGRPMMLLDDLKITKELISWEIESFKRPGEWLQRKLDTIGLLLIRLDVLETLAGKLKGDDKKSLENWCRNTIKETKGLQKALKKQKV
jgi:hypothetical protein